MLFGKQPYRSDFVTIKHTQAREFTKLVVSEQVRLHQEHCSAKYKEAILITLVVARRL